MATLHCEAIVRFWLLLPVVLSSSSSGAQKRSLRGADRRLNKGLDNSSGTNFDTGYTYSFKTDCYGSVGGRRFECPEGQWCQVVARDNWYPWDVSYMNRGRCVPYAPLGAACEVSFEGRTSFPRKSNGEFFSRQTLCGPTDAMICTGDSVFELPPTCTVRRWPEEGCMSSQPRCAGRSAGPNGFECPPESRDFCVCPATTMKNVTITSCSKQSVMTRAKLEQCGSVFNSFNGPNFGFTMDTDGLPNDNNIEYGEDAFVKKIALQHGTDSELANSILQQLWPFPVCNASSGRTDGCTSFPLPVASRNADGGLLGYLSHSNGTITPADFLQENGTPGNITGKGVIDYHCSWAILHTLSFNGNPVLTRQEQVAFGELIMYLSGQFDCKVCRNNFVNIVRRFGLPTGSNRATYAEWLWRAHNNANEHSYATHSANKERWSNWGNPVYMRPWFMNFADAARVWSGLLDDPM